MLSRDIRNLANVFEGFGDLDGPTELGPHQMRTFAFALAMMADQAAMLEAHTVPAQARMTQDNLPENVVEIPRSLPWGGHPPGSDRNGRPPEGGAA